MNDNSNLRSHEAIIRDQYRAGASMGESDAKYGGSRAHHMTIAKKPAAPKGHEAFLKALETSAAQVQVEKISNGDLIIGQVKHSDKYTITMKVDNEDGSHTNRVVFKHDISEFNSLTPRPESLETPVIR